MISSQKNFSNWKPNQTCHVNINVVAEQKKNRAKTLLQQLLLLEKPVITTNMLSFFSTEYTLDCLLDFITRHLDEEPNALMYSYKTTLILSKSSPCFERIISSNFKNMICNLIHNSCKINSNCHYYHLFEILKSFQQKYPNRFLQTLLNENLFQILLNPKLFQKEGYYQFLYHFIFDFLSIQIFDSELKEEVSYQIFIEFDIFNEVIKFICSDNEKISENAAEFLFLCLSQSIFHFDFVNSFSEDSMSMLIKTMNLNEHYEIRFSCSKIILEICQLL